MNDERSAFGQRSLSTLALLVLTATGIGICLLLLAPFFASITWALALAIAAQPVHRWMQRRLKRPAAASVCSTAAVTLGLLVPAAFLVQQVGRQAAESGQWLREALKSGSLQNSLRTHPASAELYRLADRNLDLDKAAEHLMASATNGLGGAVQSTVWIVGEFFVTVLLLFYVLRDGYLARQELNALLPLSRAEAARLLDQARSMIRATVYGTLTIALIQGSLGGLMFWVLGLPLALLWGAVMALLSLIPMLGSFLVWFPAAGWLAMQGQWGKAAILGVWGVAVIGTIDNLLHPILLGKEIRMHTAPVFLSIAGGLVVFGVSGLVLGPVALVVTWALLEIVKGRLERHGSAEEPA